jgi:hypothetical protein
MRDIAKGRGPQVAHDSVCNSLATRQCSRKLLWKLSFFGDDFISCDLPFIMKTQLVKNLHNAERYK